MSRYVIQTVAGKQSNLGAIVEYDRDPVSAVRTVGEEDECCAVISLRLT